MAKKAKFQKAKKTPKWMVENLHALPGESVTWDGTQFGSDFIVWFPRDRNPLVEGNELRAVGGEVHATVKQPYGGLITTGAAFRYCILLTDEVNKDVVVGENSPPEMIID